MPSAVASASSHGPRCDLNGSERVSGEIVSPETAPTRATALDHVARLLLCYRTLLLLPRSISAIGTSPKRSPAARRREAECIVREMRGFRVAVLLGCNPLVIRFVDCIVRRRCAPSQPR